MVDRKWPGYLMHATDGRLDVALYYADVIQHGGAERQWAEELRALRQAGVNCKGLVHRASSDVLQELDLTEDGAVEILQARTKRDRVLSLRRWLQLHNPQLLLSHTSHPLAFLATRGTGIPYVLYQNSPAFYGDFSLNPFPLARRHRRAYDALAGVTPGFHEFHASPKDFGLVRRAQLEIQAGIEAAAMRAASSVFVLSERTVSELEALYGIQAVVVRGCLPDVPPAPDRRNRLRSRLQLPEGPMLLSVCRLEPVKRIDLLLRAFEQVCNATGASLVIVGTGSELGRLRDLVSTIGLQRVVFAGYVAEDDLDEYYASSDLFVAPATADYNIAPYEAVWRGLPALVSDELEVEDWLVASGWLHRAAPTATEFAAGIRSALQAGAPTDPPELRPLTWSARAQRIIEVLNLSRRDLL